MAQDFGDDAGELFTRSFARAAGQALRYHLTHRDNGNGIPEVSDEPDENRLVCVPFGKEEDAAYFAQVLIDNGIDAVPLTDNISNGYVQFPVADLEGIKACAPQYAELMTKSNLERIEWALDNGPLSESSLSRLRESTILSERARTHSGPEQGEKTTPSRPPRANHTQVISDKVRTAREQCTDFDDFERILAGEGVGISTTKAGENLFYEARFAENGRMLPFGRDKDGHMDWAVGADTLKKRWGVDATHDWFEKNARAAGRSAQSAARKEAEARAADGALDTDGATPSLDQDIKSHDGMDTDERTARIEREQHGTDVAPSKVREEQGYSLQSEAQDMRAASKQLDMEHAAPARELGISDKLSQVR